ncbi:MAG: NAD(P)H-binding protein [Woeseiaceae bacterium]|nr:NAD(P)H-binding protein [Woeseiaceae bacterium]
MRFYRKINSLLIVLLLINTTIEAKESILVVGGTGRVGSEIVKILSAEDKKITVLSRSNNNYSRLKGLNIDYFKGDVLNEKDIERVFLAKDYDVIINALAKVGNSPNPHALGQKHLIKWSKKTGIKHFILIGSVGAGSKQSELVSDIVWSMWKDILQEKGKAEASLINSNLPFTIIRTGIVVYDDTPATGNAELLEDDTIVGIITRKDLAQLTGECVLNGLCFNKIYHAFDASLGNAIE